MPTYEKLLAAAGERLITVATQREYTYALSHGDRNVELSEQKRIEQEVRKRVQACLRPWFTVVKPAELTKLVDEMRVVASRLNVGGTASALVPASPAIDDLTQLRTKLAELDGAAITAFRTNYADPLPAVVAGHCSIAAFLGSVLVGEQRVWTAVRHDVLEVVRRATELMERGLSGAWAGAPAPATSAQIAFKVAGTEVGTGGVFADGDASAAAGSGLLGELGPLLPTVAASTSTTPSIGGDRWFSIMDSTERVLAALSDAVETRENTFGDACTAAVHLIGSRRAAFDLASPSSVLEQTDVSGLGVGGSAKEIKLDLDVVRKIGNDLMPGIADAYLSAVKHAEHAVDSSAWTRSERIGLAPRGAYAGWKKLHDELLELLRETRHEVQRAGNHLMIAGRLVNESDEDVRAQLKEHRDRGARLVLEGSVEQVTVGSQVAPAAPAPTATGKG